MRQPTRESESIGSLPRPTLREWEEEESFSDALYGWMERAPWLVLSGAFHFILFLIIAAIPWSALQENEDQYVTTDIVEAVEEIEREEPDPEPEKLPTEESEQLPEIESFDLAETDTDAESESHAESESTVPSLSNNPFESAGENSVLGIGGGGGSAGGGFGRGGRRGRAPRQTAAAVERGLAWLAAHQDTDGRWNADDFMQHDPTDNRTTGAGDPNHDVGLTGLALLAFLGDDHTMVRGKYRDHVARGARFLLAEQDRESGLIGEPVGQSYIYDHALATLALCELWRMDRAVVLKSRTQLAVNALQKHRQPYGAWGYHPPPSGAQDTSVTGWALFALKAADEGGLRVDREAFVAAQLWLEEMTDPATGRVGYNERGSRSSRVPGINEHFAPERGEALTAVGLLCQFFLGNTPETSPSMRSQADLIGRLLPRWDPEGGDCDMYYWYYGSYAMFQMGGAHWKAWNRAMKSAVVESQRRDGSALGSWDPVGPWGAQGGRVYATATMVLCLEVYYRYARLTGTR